MLKYIIIATWPNGKSMSHLFDDHDKAINCFLTTYKVWSEYGLQTLEIMRIDE